MNIIISRLFKTIKPEYYSASCAELGENAGRITWENAMEACPRLLKSSGQLSDFKKYMAGFGAWDDVEIAKWTSRECNALLLQLIAGDIREAGVDTKNPNWNKYQVDSEAGIIHGNMYRGDDGQVYYYIGD